MLRKMMGGGEVMDVKVSLPGRGKDFVPARLGLFDSDLGVLLAGTRLLGSVLVPRWPVLAKILPPGMPRNKFKEWKKEWREFMVVGSLDRAYRMMLHILFRYGLTFEEGERAALNQLMTLSRELNTEILGVTKEDIEYYRGRWDQKIREIRLLLGKPRFSLPKLDILSQLHRISEGVDSFKRVNEPAFLARSMAVQTLVKEREEEIVNIQKFIRARRDVIGELLLWSKCYLERAYDFLDKLFKEEVLLSADFVTRKRVAHWLVFLSEDLVTIDFSPFVLNFRLCYNEFNNAKNLLLKKDFNHHSLMGVESQLSRSRESLKIKVIQRDLERVILFCTELLYKKRITENEWAQINQALQEIRENLQKVDEFGFKIKVCKQAIENLNVAITDFEMKDPTRLAIAREYLKDASRVL